MPRVSGGVSPPAVFDIHCRRCARLARFLSQVRERYPAYHARPVAPFGAADARLLIVGLAPGMHGANRSGRPFTGDHAGLLLYRTLHELGLASRADSTRVDDGLTLKSCRITNAVKCLPPRNKPNGAEIKTCNRFLVAELESLASGAVVLALGAIAHQAVLRAWNLPFSQYPFGHGREYPIGEYFLVDSYHCSRYNTQTRRLTEPMFQTVVRRALQLVGDWEDG